MHAWTGVSRVLPSLYRLPPPMQVFAFDHCFWSMDESNIPKYAGESKMRILSSTSKKANCVKCGDLLVVLNRKKRSGGENSPVDEKLFLHHAN